MILVCGGAGYIGSHAVYRLIEQGEQVVVIDNLQKGHREAVHPRAVLYEGDLRERSFLRRVFARHAFDTVLHFAASSVVEESMEKPLEYYDNNVYGTQVLLETLCEHRVMRLVFSSSAAVYGQPEELPITETTPLAPTSAYGETKLAIEKMLYWTARAHGVRYVSLRYFNVAGAYGKDLGEDHHPETHLVPIALEVALGQRESVKIFGNDYDTRDGTCVRDYIHVLDLVDAHLLAVEKLRRHGELSEVINLGNGRGFTVSEVIDAARRVTGHGIPVRITDRRPGDPDRLVASAARAKLELGWQPRYTTIDEIVQSAWIWHQSHPTGYC
jgi:UDP-glucose 4-epimerase